MEFVLIAFEPEFWLFKASFVPPSIRSRHTLLHRFRQLAQRFTRLLGLCKRLIFGAHEERVFRVESGPLAGALWKYQEAFPWYQVDQYELDIGACVAAHLGRNDTFWDIGASAGYHALIGVRAVGPGGRVLAVEQDPQACVAMQEQLALNGVDNTTIVTAAIAPWTDSSDIGASRTTLQQLAEQFPAPSVLKMDVHDAEDQILSAAESFFTGPHRPRVVILRYHGTQSGEICMQRMHEYGYAIVPRPGFVIEPVPECGTTLWYDNRLPALAE